MISELTKYQAEIDEVLKRYSIGIAVTHMGIALHKITYNHEKRLFDYECIGINETYKKILNLDDSNLKSVRYQELFPQNKENKFDWASLIGHIGEFQSLTKYYCFSEPLNKWYRFIALSPEKGLTLLVAEEISNIKQEEINQNRAKASIGGANKN
jgi:hypothetical protein